MARIRLRGWFAIRLESIFTVAGNGWFRATWLSLTESHAERAFSIHLPQKC